MHDAFLNHMKQIAEIQGGDSQEINTIKQSHCKQCGNTHGYQKGKCPAWGTMCSACGKKNHWAKMCTNKNENKRRFARACTTHNPKQPRVIQNKKRNNRICAMNSDTREPSMLYREFEQLTFDVVQQQRDNRTEIFTELQIRLPDRPGTHTLKAKVDTGAEDDTLSPRTFRRMFPDKVDDLGQPIPGSTKKELLKPYEISVRPWQLVATDLFQFGISHYTLVVDYYSKYPLVRKFKDFSTQEIINFTKQIFGEQGIPERSISDNGPHYSSILFKQFSREWGFEHYTSSPRYPQSNGLSERCVQAIKSAMQKKAALSNRDLDMVLLCLRSTPINHVIPSPGELLFNRKLVGNLPVKCPNNATKKEKIATHLYQRQSYQKSQHDRHIRDLPNILEGQRVRVYDPDSSKWSPTVVTQMC